jgi:hypothetical protein
LIAAALTLQLLYVCLQLGDRLVMLANTASNKQMVMAIKTVCKNALGSAQTNRIVIRFPVEPIDFIDGRRGDGAHPADGVDESLTLELIELVAKFSLTQTPANGIDTATRLLRGLLGIPAGCQDLQQECVNIFAAVAFACHQKNPDA